MTTHQRPSPYLRAILSHLLDHAEDNPGQTVSTRLTNNLKIDLLVRAGWVQLQISRSSAWPSEADWRMVLRHWPYRVEARPEPLESQGRRFLTARLPLY
ncbi:MAG: hypothetical protein A2Z45_02005 [Chloroflexi bacterium RBG_19FT_COMBO_55_16]|nr:MAG: hypothetical protein A2Z45_02005 [Chloroflexi bacterium RBG_19FT_COMBO_55_16]